MRRALALTCVVSLGLALLGCQREQRRFSEVAPASGQPRRLEQNMADVRGPYPGNAWAVAEGKQLYARFNCVGCHANGGGGMGPPLMDPEWIYGGFPAAIYESIVEGRPNGMPAFGGKLADSQAWQLVAYVQALSGQLRRDVRPGRGDNMSMRPSEQAGLPKTAEPRPRLLNPGP
jgi:cytochrome c oxidase cbb3-type subunit 3